MKKTIFMLWYLTTIASIILMGVGHFFNIAIVTTIAQAGILLSGAIMLFMYIQAKTKPRDKSFVLTSETLGEITSSSGKLALCGNDQFINSVEFELLPADYPINLTIRKYKDGEQSIEAITLGSGEESVKRESSQSLVVDAGLVFIISSEALVSAPAMKLLREQAVQALEEFDGKFFSHILSIDGKKVGAVIMPPEGDGIYPVEKLSTDMRPSGLRCTFQSEVKE